MAAKIDQLSSVSISVDPRPPLDASKSAPSLAAQAAKRGMPSQASSAVSLKMREVAVHNSRVNAVFLFLFYVAVLAAIGYACFLVAPLLAAALVISEPLAHVVVGFFGLVVAYLVTKAVSPAISKAWTTNSVHAPEIRLPEEADEIHFPTAPMGLINRDLHGRKTNYCWINSLLQMVMNVEGLKTSACLFNDPSFQRFYDTVEREQGRRTVTTADTRVIADDLSHKLVVGPSRIACRGRQEDAADALQAFFSEDRRQMIQNAFRDEGPVFSVETTEVYRSRTTPEIMLSVQMKPNATMSEILFDGLKKQGKKLTQGTPSQFCLHIDRNVNGGKILEDIQGPIDGTSLSFRTKEEEQIALYNCHAFINHLGESAQNGHYVAFVKKDGQWFCCDDEKVLPITEAQARVHMRQACIYHFSKVSIA